MAIELDNDDLLIKFEPGNVPLLVVAFTGIGHGMGAIQTEEFRKSLGSVMKDDKIFHIIRVIEKRRLWFNHGVIEPITAHVNAIIAREGITRVVTLGHSMGAFGAIIFAKRFQHCTQAIAFSPQSSVQPEIVPFELRWQIWRQNIMQWDIPDATTELSPGVRYDIFFGTQDELDMRHAARFSQEESPNAVLHLIAGAKHSVVTQLKETGKLYTILHDLVWTAPTL